MLHISYYNATHGNLMYARKVGRRWSSGTVASRGDVGWNNALALKRDGQPHYYDATSGNLRHAVRTLAVIDR